MVASRITPLVALVLAPNPGMMTLTGTNSYLVGQAGSPEVVVVDPGPDLPEHVDALVEALTHLGGSPMSFVTHHHGDHLPAAVRLRERLGAPIAGHPELPGVDRALDHDEVMALGSFHLRALATPGHTRDHMCLLLEEERALFTGDLIAGTGTVIVGDGPGDLADYMHSLELVERLGARVILPGHGPVVEDPEAKIGEYLRHRRLREAQILDVLRHGPTTIEDLVARLYADVRPELHGMAARNVGAHLSKLRHDGRATPAVSGVDDGAWRSVDEGRP